MEGEKIFWVRGVDKGGGVRYIGKCATNEANRPEPRPNLEKPIV